MNHNNLNESLISARTIAFRSKTKLHFVSCVLSAHRRRLNRGGAD